MIYKSNFRKPACSCSSTEHSAIKMQKIMQYYYQFYVRGEGLYKTPKATEPGKQAGDDFSKLHFFRKFSLLFTGREIINQTYSIFHLFLSTLHNH